MFHVVIPARYGSTRLPGKALADICGEPMIYWVWQRALEASPLSVVVATDDQRIADVMSARGADVVMTREDHPSGTDRLAEVAAIRDWSDAAIVVNLQGDEPLMPSENLRQVAALLEVSADAAVATLSVPITEQSQMFDPSVVKVVTDADGYAAYFSRASIPWHRDVFAADNKDAAIAADRHAGLYAYRAGFLRRFVELAPAPTEVLESLEQLRALYYGHRIRVETAKAPIPIGVDTAEDLAHVQGLMEGDH
ncbi:3-deoxy-D-manno-octulosonate cytidylyltransferase [Luminiphilus syltensis NOR5-1B]|uniref:3-deoxy-manno-octulosonate cytidylyltransferase n=1 Tax=Luminiphilus syltensis NOR5-1B TaxID=565045 RepID=B8KYJ7_9GAMM|nr:3-deoxy-manno-octulosonate cytidylyltransferase [Luminiphilus syltensis]EED36082.1 3-deoxy-D-manno-octulosonate cytidylyltransferase [Luminiphilus syltensis NOR5-1B]